VSLVPLHGGALHERVLVLDPGGNGGDAAPQDAGLSPADAAFQVAVALHDLLQAAGARALLVRRAAEIVSDVARVQRATDLGAHRYLRIDVVPGGNARLLHYPGSADGERLARALASWWARRNAGRGVPVAADTRLILQQTPCPAALVELPLRSAQDAEATRAAAYALFVGMRAAFDSAGTAAPPLAGVVVEETAGVGTSPDFGLVSLDGAEVLGVGKNGRFVFEAVAPGAHLVRLHGLRPLVSRVQVAARDTTHVRLAAPPPVQPSGNDSPRR
jgi:hypothetical protein